MKIYSCIQFWSPSELPLLKIRCEELSVIPNIVHVLVESNITHSGKPKDLVFRDVEGFEQYPIRYIVLNQAHESPMANENYHRNQIIHGLKDATDEDVVIISDLDEIPRASTIAQYTVEMGLHYLEMDNFGFWLNCKTNDKWKRAAILPYKFLKVVTPQQIRDGNGPCMKDAGWHYAWQGGVDAVMAKFGAFCHQEPDVQSRAVRDDLVIKIATGQSLWGKDMWSFVPIDSTFPSYLVSHQEEFKHLIHASNS